MKPLIVALDVDTDKEAMALLRATKKYVDIFKVGPSLVLKYGPQIFKKIRHAKKKIFLDLKLHDIPNTMLRAIKEAGKNSIYSATVHISAGESALKAVAGVSKRPLVWGVTVLTSLTHNDLNTLGFRNSTEEQVSQLALLAKKSKLDGVVASVGETAGLRKQLGPQFQIITPGIRLPGHELGDQRRIATPAHAREAGATFMVVGRPIIEANDPAYVARSLLLDWKRTQ